MSTKSRTRVAGKALRKAGVGGAALVIAAATAAAGAGVANANTTFAFSRIAGPDRYDTSVATAQAFGPSTNLILASGAPDHTVDALTAAYLAGIQNAPILLTKTDMTPQNVRDQITASGAKNITIVGGTDVVSQAQEDALRASGLTVTRLSGDDRYATGAAVIGAGGAATTQTALLATGQNFADALGGGALADAKRLPLGLTKTDSLPASTLAAFKAAGITKVIVLGGVAAVSQAVVDQLAANSITVITRLGGADRAGTSAALADYEITNYGFTNKHVNVASGYALGGGADALGGDALSAQQLTPLLITNNILDPGTGVEAFLRAHAPTLQDGIIFGDASAVAASTETTMTANARTAPAATFTTSTIPLNVHPRTVAVDPTIHTAYVTTIPTAVNQGGTVLVIDTTTNTITHTIPVGAGAVAVDPTTHTVYLINGSVTGGSAVLVIDGATNTITHTIPLPLGTYPGEVAVDPTTHTVYVTNIDTAHNGTVSVIDGATNTITNTIPVGAYPGKVAVDPPSHTAYVTGSGGVSVIDTTTNTVTHTIPVRGEVAVDPSTHTVYATTWNAIGGGTVSVIDTTTNTVTHTIPVGNEPLEIGIDPSTHTVYVLKQNDSLTGFVSVIDTTTNTVTQTIPSGVEPSEMVVDPSTHTVYVANFYSTNVNNFDSGTVSVIQRHAA